MPDLESLKEFKSRIQSADVSELRDTIQRGRSRRAVAPVGPAPDAATETKTEFDRMQAYVNKFYEGVESKHTFLDSAGNHVDCIPFEQQPTAKAAVERGYSLRKGLATPAKMRQREVLDPGGFAPQVMNVIPHLQRGTVDLFGNRRSCPKGCVPIRRISLNRVARQGTLESFFKKNPARITPMAAVPFVQDRFGFTHRHAIAQNEPRSVTGASTWLNLWQPDYTPGTMSLSQLWIVRRRGDDPNYVQTIESGWQIEPGRTHTEEPVLFVFFNPDNYNEKSSGYLSDQNMFGFVQTSSDWVIDATIPGPYSSRGGAQIGLRMQWQTDADGNWILFLSDSSDQLHEVGYFPGALYSGEGYGDWDTVQFGGEVGSVQNSSATGRMGSGISPTGSSQADFGQVAFQRGLAIQTEVGGEMIPASVNPPPQDPRDLPYISTTGSTDHWGSYLFFGG